MQGQRESCGNISTVIPLPSSVQVCEICKISHLVGYLWCLEMSPDEEGQGERSFPKTL